MNVEKIKPIPSREICKACYEIIRVGFTVPGEIWNIAVPEMLRDHCLCLNCFTRLADDYLLPWDENIQFWPVSLLTHITSELTSS